MRRIALWSVVSLLLLGVLGYATLKLSHHAVTFSVGDAR